MNAISLWEPWATLVSIWAKRYETRSWPTLHRGVIAIHSAQRFDGEQKAICSREPFKTALAREGIDHWRKLVPTLGHVLAIAVLKRCQEVRCERPPAQLSWTGSNEITSLEEYSEEDLAFGDWSEGRFIWTLEDVVRLVTPVPARGAQGFWTWKPPPMLQVEQPNHDIREWALKSG